MNNQKGFTLIELIITLAIMGILSAYGLPNFYELKLNKQLQSERNRLTGSLQLARSYSVMHQSFVIVCPSLSGNGCDNQSNWHEGWIIFTDKNKNRQLDPEDRLLRHEDAMVKQIQAVSSSHRSKIRYNNIGFSPGTNLSINFCDPRGEEKAIALIVSNSGRVKQSKPISSNVCSQ